MQHKYPGDSDDVRQMPTPINKYVKAVRGSERLRRRFLPTAWHPGWLNKHAKVIITPFGQQWTDPDTELTTTTLSLWVHP